MSQQDARAQTTQVQLREYCILGRTNASIIFFDFVLYIALASELYRLVASIDACLPTFVREQKNICEGPRCRYAQAAESRFLPNHDLMLS